MQDTRAEGTNKSHYQQAAWMWEVSPHLPCGKLEHEEGREPWGEYSCLSLPKSCTWNPVQVKLLQPVAVFKPAPRHARASVLVFILLRAHTGEKKAAVSLNEVLWGCLCVVNPIFLTFLPLVSSSTQQGRAGEGTVLFQRQRDASQGGCPHWDVKPKAGQELDEASFAFSDSEEQGAQLLGLLLPQKGERRGWLLLGTPWSRSRERLPLLPVANWNNPHHPSLGFGRNGPPGSAALAKQWWVILQIWPSTPFSSRLVCLYPTTTAEENAQDRGGKRPNPRWHSSFRLGRTTVREQPVWIQRQWKNGTSKRTLCCLYFLRKALFVMPPVFEGRRAELQEFDLSLERRGKAGHSLFGWFVYFLKTHKTEKTTYIIIHQGCAATDPHMRLWGVHPAHDCRGQPDPVHL